MANSQPAETEAAFIARVKAEQGITLRPEEAGALLGLVTQLNGTVSAAADLHVGMDAAPWSFATLRAEIAERGEDEA
ncbi:hypothetical protein ACLBXM_00535 [Xanthobacteraceae bacterium A53D]